MSDLGIFKHHQTACIKWQQKVGCSLLSQVKVRAQPPSPVMEKAWCCLSRIRRNWARHNPSTISRSDSSSCTVSSAWFSAQQGTTEKWSKCRNEMGTTLTLVSTRQRPALHRPHVPREGPSPEIFGTYRNSSAQLCGNKTCVRSQDGTKLYKVCWFCPSPIIEKHTKAMQSCTIMYLVKWRHQLAHFQSFQSWNEKHKHNFLSQLSVQSKWHPIPISWQLPWGKRHYSLWAKAQLKVAICPTKPAHIWNIYAISLSVGWQKSAGSRAGGQDSNCEWWFRSIYCIMWASLW